MIFISHLQPIKSSSSFMSDKALPGTFALRSQVLLHHHKRRLLKKQSQARFNYDRIIHNDVSGNFWSSAINKLHF